MCGIFLIFSKNGVFDKDTHKKVISNFKKLTRRGPDAYSLSIVDGCLIGFQRLAINDISEKGMQPFQLGATFTVCNGEIYNYETLAEPYHNDLKSKSDCEILPYLFRDSKNIAECANSIDGVFAIAHHTNNKIILMRDRIGVKPMFFAENDDFFGVASEAKSLNGLQFDNIKHVLPGHIVTYNTLSYRTNVERYTTLPSPTPESLGITYDDAKKNVHDLLVKAVQKRLSSDRDIGCLLSGGLDSSIIAAILAREMKNKGKTLRTFSVGFPDSTDIIYAREVAKHIGSEHHEHIIQYEDALHRINDVIYATETFDTTSVRASTPMYLLCEWITQNFPDKVIFSGEGSDELFCGYLYFHNAPTPQDAHDDTIRLVNELYLYDVLRADRCTAGNGLEFREPFLDKELVDFVVKMNPSHKSPSIVDDNLTFEKTILREAFESYLPPSVAWRRKAAFSDAVSSHQKPWYKWIQEFVEDKKVTDYGGTPENNYYKTLFYSYFNDYSPTIPLWLPKWSNVGSEPSATVLNVYKKDEH